MMINDGDHDHDDKDDDEDDHDHDALPPKNRMNSSIVANLKHAFGATSRDLVCLNIILVSVLCESKSVKGTSRDLVCPNIISISILRCSREKLW